MKVVVNEPTALQIVSRPTLRKLLPCLEKWSISEIDELKNTCRTCPGKQKQQRTKKAQIVRDVKICLFSAPPGVMEEIKNQLRASVIVIHMDIPGYPKRTVK